MSKHKPIPQELLDQLAYDETSPTCLRWKSTRQGRRRDLVAGSPCPGGYARVGHGATTLRVHRVVWALHHGDPGTAQVDHIDTDTSNNRIENLQLVDNAGNARRQVGRGVHEAGGKWSAGISVGGQRVSLGRWGTEAEARAAYVGAKLVAARGLTPQLEEFRHDS